jgi:hypothetical protein
MVWAHFVGLQTLIHRSEIAALCKHFHLRADAVAELKDKRIFVKYIGVDDYGQTQVRTEDINQETGVETVNQSRINQLELQKYMTAHQAKLTEPRKEAKWMDVLVEPEICQMSKTGPEIRHTGKFDLSLTRPDAIVAEAIKLADAVKMIGAVLTATQLNSKSSPSLEEMYRLELQPIASSSKSLHSTWSLRLSLHPVAWFNAVFPEKEDLEKREKDAHIARTYIDCMKNAYRAQPAEYNDQDAAVEAINPQGEVCFSGLKCPHLPTGSCARYHTTISCAQYVFRRDAPAPCSWSAQDHLILWMDEKWLLHARAQSVRDIMLLPRPPAVHMTNKQAVQEPEYWEQVIRSCALIHRAIHEQGADASSTAPSASAAVAPTASASASASSPSSLPASSLADPSTLDLGFLECIAANFGPWETSVFKDNMALSCHSHTHFLIKRDVISQLGSSTFENFKCMKDRTTNPPHYDLENALLLEREVVLAYENRILKERMAQITKQQATIIQMLQQLMEAKATPATPAPAAAASAARKKR